jgi:hypothetical protein
MRLIAKELPLETATYQQKTYVFSVYDRFFSVFDQLPDQRFLPENLKELLQSIYFQLTEVIA